MPITPGVPAVGGGKRQHRRLRLGFDRGDRRRQGACLDLAPLAVECVQPLRQFGGQRRIVGREQPRPGIGGAHPPAGIDPRAQHKTEMIGIDRLGEAGNLGECVKPGIAPLARDLDALRDERAIEAGQRHDIAHGSQGDEVEPLSRSGSLREPAYQPAARNARLTAIDQQKGDTDRRERAMRARFVEPVRIDERRARSAAAARRRDGRSTITSSPHRAASASGSMGGGAAIDGDDDARALRAQKRSSAGMFGP